MAALHQHHIATHSSKEENRRNQQTSNILAHLHVFHWDIPMAKIAKQQPQHSKDCGKNTVFLKWH
jgi:hypothetical protein